MGEGSETDREKIKPKAKRDYILFNHNCHYLSKLFKRPGAGQSDALYCLRRRLLDSHLTDGETEAQLGEAQGLTASFNWLGQDSAL